MAETKTSILNYETVDLLRDKVIYKKVTVRDFEILEQLLEAFGKPRNLILKQFYAFSIYSYEEYIHESKHPIGSHLPSGAVGKLMGRIMICLDRMAEYFIEKENLNPPETWELKDPNSL
jgi:hypothetical protein